MGQTNTKTYKETLGYGSEAHRLQIKLSTKEYTLDEAVVIAIREGYRIFIFTPGERFYYLKGKDMSIETASNLLNKKVDRDRKRTCCILNY